MFTVGAATTTAAGAATATAAGAATTAAGAGAVDVTLTGAVTIVAAGVLVMATFRNVKNQIAYINRHTTAITPNQNSHFGNSPLALAGVVGGPLVVGSASTIPSAGAYGSLIFFCSFSCTHGE